MQLSTINNQLAMSSREIADLLESRHDKVKQSIERLADRGAISQPPLGDGEKSANGVVEKVYLVNKRDSYVVVAQLSPEFTARLVDRWQELEARQVKALPSYADALRQLADQVEENERKSLLIEQQRPAVEFVDRYVEAHSAKGFREVAKIMGIPERKFIQFLAEEKIIFKQGSNWLPMSDHQGNGRFTVKTGEANGHAFVQTRFTPLGVAWIAQRLIGGIA